MRGSLLVVTALAASVLGGCASVYYNANVASAHTRVEQAREMGAETAAPFEYYYAKEHLRQAQLEAAGASYGDAADYAEIAETYAQKAIDITKSSRKAEAK
jgi:hypothetical protein